MVLQIRCRCVFSLSKRKAENGLAKRFLKIALEKTLCPAGMIILGQSDSCAGRFWPRPQTHKPASARHA